MDDLNTKEVVVDPEAVHYPAIIVESIPEIHVSQIVYKVQIPENKFIFLFQFNSIDPIVLMADDKLYELTVPEIIPEDKILYFSMDNSFHETKPLDLHNDIFNITQYIMILDDQYHISDQTHSNIQTLYALDETSHIISMLQHERDNIIKNCREFDETHHISENLNVFIHSTKELLHNYFSTNENETSTSIQTNETANPTIETAESTIETPAIKTNDTI